MQISVTILDEIVLIDRYILSRFKLLVNIYGNYSGFDYFYFVAFYYKNPNSIQFLYF